MRLNISNITNLRKLTSEPKRLLIFLIALGLVLFLNTCASTNIQGVVEKVVDGDTIVLLDDKKQKHTIRFFGIDAPETTTKQPFGEEAKQFLASKITDKKVKIIVKDKDKYGRIVGIVKFEGRDINEEMVKEGYAWAYSYYSEAYVPQHRKAKEQKLGLWADEKAQEPYKWRKAHRTLQ